MNKLLFIVFAAFSAACSDTTPLPADPQATPETQALYRNLFRIADEGVMFGHQDDALYGHDWKYEEGRSDVRECCGDYPAVFGWELGVMTAMFVVIFMDQWLKEKHHFSAWIGLIASVACLLIFGADNFLIPTMICILVALTALRKPVEAKTQEAVK